MKKILFTLLVLFVCFKGISQGDNAVYGVRGAFNLSGLSFGDSPKIFQNENRKGVAFGFFAEVNITDNFIFSPELQYSAEGAKSDLLRVDYLHLPLLIKFKFGEFFGVTGGPVASLKVNEFQDKSVGVEEDDFNTLGFSGVLGAEVRFLEPFFADIRYYYGLTDIFNKDFALEAKNTNIQIGVGIKF